MSVCGHVMKCRGPQRPEAWDSPAAGETGSWELLELNSGKAVQASPPREQQELSHQPITPALSLVS